MRGLGFFCFVVYGFVVGFVFCVWVFGVFFGFFLETLEKNLVILLIASDTLPPASLRYTKYVWKIKLLLSCSTYACCSV